MRAAVDCRETDGGEMRLWWEMPVEESQAAMETRQDTAESCEGVEPSP